MFVMTDIYQLSKIKGIQPALTATTIAAKTQSKSTLAYRVKSFRITFAAISWPRLRIRERSAHCSSIGEAVVHYFASELPKDPGWSAAIDRPGASARLSRSGWPGMRMQSVRWEQSATEEAEDEARIEATPTIDSQ
jgi:hypothetical protein